MSRQAHVYYLERLAGTFYRGKEEPFSPAGNALPSKRTGFLTRYKSRQRRSKVQVQDMKPAAACRPIRTNIDLTRENRSIPLDWRRLVWTWLRGDYAMIGWLHDVMANLSARQNRQPRQNNQVVDVKRARTPPGCHPFVIAVRGAV